MENINIEYKSEIPKKSNHLKAEIVKSRDSFFFKYRRWSYLFGGG